MNKEEKQFVAEGITKALVSFIPGIGGAIGSILSDALADRKEQRIKEFLASLKEEINSNKEHVNNAFVSHEEFLDVFELTAKKIADERSAEKREAFKNILLTGIFSNNYSFDEVEYQLRILDLLNNEHILLLSLFNDPNKFKTQKLEQFKGNTLLKLFRSIFPNWQYDHLFDHIRDLENNRLIESITPNLQSMVSLVTLESLNGQLTSKGVTFVSFIIKK